MAKDHLAGNVSKPDGGFYKSSEEIRAEDAAKAAEVEEVVEEVVKEEEKVEPPSELEAPLGEEPPASVRVQRIRDSQK